jgi:hypothetical protein
MHEAFTESIRKRQVSVQEKLDSAIHNGKRATSLSTKANGTSLVERDGSRLQQSAHLDSGPLAPTGRGNAALLQTGYNGAGMTSQPAACSS